MDASQSERVRSEESLFAYVLGTDGTFSAILSDLFERYPPAARNT